MTTNLDHLAEAVAARLRRTGHLDEFHRREARVKILAALIRSGAHDPDERMLAEAVRLTDAILADDPVEAYRKSAPPKPPGGVFSTDDFSRDALMSRLIGGEIGFNPLPPEEVVEAMTRSGYRTRYTDPSDQGSGVQQRPEGWDDQENSWQPVDVNGDPIPLSALVAECGACGLVDPVRGSSLAGERPVCPTCGVGVTIRPRVSAGDALSASGSVIGRATPFPAVTADRLVCVQCQCPGIKHFENGRCIACGGGQ